MIDSFKNQGTADIFDGINSKAARKICPESIWRVAIRKLDQIDSVTSIDELAVPPGNHLEKLSGERAKSAVLGKPQVEHLFKREGRYSIRINDQYRICFEWSESDARAVEIVEHH